MPKFSTCRSPWIQIRAQRSSTNGSSRAVTSASKRQARAAEEGVRVLGHLAVLGPERRRVGLHQRREGVVEGVDDQLGPALLLPWSVPSRDPRRGRRRAAPTRQVEPSPSAVGRDRLPAHASSGSSRAVEDRVDVLGVAHERRASAAAWARTRGSSCRGQRGRARTGAGDVVLRRDLEAHLGRPVVLVGQPGDDGVGGRVVPAVEQATGAPGADPVVLPDRAASRTGSPPSQACPVR